MTLKDGDLVKVLAGDGRKYQDREVRYGTVIYHTHVAPDHDMLYIRFPNGATGFYKPERLVKCTDKNWNID